MENNRNCRLNLIQVKLIKIADQKNVKVQVLEQGTGCTLPEGVCSRAVIATAYELGLVDRKITIHTGQGELEVEITESGSVKLFGEAKKQASLIVSKEVLRCLIDK